MKQKKYKVELKNGVVSLSRLEMEIIISLEVNNHFFGKYMPDDFHHTLLFPPREREFTDEELIQFVQELFTDKTKIEKMLDIQRKVLATTYSQLKAGDKKIAMELREAWEARGEYIHED